MVGAEIGILCKYEKKNIISHDYNTELQITSHKSVFCEKKISPLPPPLTK